MQSIKRLFSPLLGEKERPSRRTYIKYILGIFIGLLIGFFLILMIDFLVDQVGDAALYFGIFIGAIIVWLLAFYAPVHFYIVYKRLRNIGLDWVFLLLPISVVGILVFDWTLLAYGLIALVMLVGCLPDHVVTKQPDK